MAGNTENGGGRRGSRWRIAAWAAPVVLFGAGLKYELVARTMANIAYRAAVAMAVATAFLLLWINGAVGIIGNENDDANLMVFGVLAVGIISANIARFKPDRMARAMVAMALAQALVAAIAVIAGLGSTGPGQLPKCLPLTGFFAVLWLISAWLFRKAARGGPERGAV